MSRLATSYLGLDLRSPVVASASPLTDQLEMALRLEDAGAGAIVMPSLFSEEIEREELDLTGVLEAGAEHFAEALDYFPALPEYATAADRYLDTLATLTGRLEIPVIASLNATSPGEWIRYASVLQDAGAAAAELNLYHVAADATRSGAQVEGSDLAIVAGVRAAVGLPLAVKLSPYYSSMANLAERMVTAGADGLVLFNRFYQPDLDLDSLEVVSRLVLSEPWEMRLPLRWIAILRPLLAGRASLAHTSGICTGLDVAKALLVGADVAMMTSALLRSGPEHVRTVTGELAGWLDERGYASVDELRGSVSYATSDDPSAFERANYVRVLHSWTAPHERMPRAPSA